MKEIDTQMEIAIKCVRCNDVHTIYAIKTEDYQRWVNGEGYIQDLMPYLQPWEREMLISATCDKCWNEMFGDAEEEEQEDDDEETVD